MNILRFNELIRLGCPAALADECSSLFKGGGGGKQTQNTTSVSKPHQQGQYDQLLEGADAWKENGFDKNYGGSADFNPVAGFTDEQKASLGGMQGTGAGLSDIYNGLGMDGLKDMLGTYDPSKTGLNDALGAANERMNFDFQTQQMPQIRQGAQGAGQFGSSRHGIAEGLAQDRLSQNQANAGAQMAFQDQQNWNNNRNSAIQNLSNISKGINSGNAIQYDAGALQQGQNQADIKGQLEKWAYENNVDMNDLLAYKNVISGDMGGTVTTNGVSKGGGGGGGGGGSAMGALGSIGGAALGGFFGGPAGAMAGSSVGGSVGGLMG